MTKQEFYDIKEEFAAVTCKFEQMNKKVNELRAKYNKYFFPQIMANKHLVAEISLLTNLVSLKSKNENDEEIERVRNEFVNKVLAEEIDDINKHNKFVSIVNNFEKHTQEENDQFEFKVENFILDYHPFVNINMNPKVQNVFKLLMTMYYDNNIEGFDEIFEMNKNGLAHPEIGEDDYQRAQKLYLQFKIAYQKNYNELKNQFPLNKEVVFLNEVSMDSEKDDLEISIKKLLGMNEAIHKDYIATFGSDYKIPFQTK